MKKKIYETFVKQTFNAFFKEKSDKWYIPCKIVEKRDSVTYYDAYILAESKEKAIEIYKERYYWNDFDKVINPWYGQFSTFPWVNTKNPEFEYEVCAKEIHPKIESLKANMRADEFLEYCRQEMMPLEVVLGDKE